MFAEIDTSRPFALFEKDGFVTGYQGEFHALKKLDDIHMLARKTGRDVVFVLPYCIIRERGFEAHGDEPILAIAVETAIRIPKENLVAELADAEISLEGEITPSLSDAEYANLVRRFQRDEIEAGHASQCTLARSFCGQIKEFYLPIILSIYRKALQQTGQYMTVLFANGTDQFIIGATPEKHLEVRGNETIMIPIAGTLRKEDKSTFAARLKNFLNDPKEINELFQVVDEEMKMMGVICPDGGIIHGPFLREIGAVVHTEYQLIGLRTKDTIAALRRTLHAPTVVGSPMESAARIIKKYEPESRRYYAGEIGIYHCPRTGAPNGDLDCAILIRCAEIDGVGNFRIQAGGGLVRDSDPDNEAAESRAKAMGILGILTGTSKFQDRYLTNDLHAEVAPLLESRNEKLSHFWMDRQNPFTRETTPIDGMRITIINNEDDFAFMTGHMLRVRQAHVRVVNTFECDVATDNADVVIIGPGPGDPTNMNHPRMYLLQKIITDLKSRGQPLLGICLGHQALAVHAGLTVTRQAESTQGLQREMIVMGETHRLGFYNSFSPVHDDAARSQKDFTFDLDENNRIIAMQSRGVIGFQAHPESIMSERGMDLLLRALNLLYPMNDK